MSTGRPFKSSDLILEGEASSRNSLKGAGISSSRLSRKFPRRGMRRRALVVGINYRRWGHIALKGAVNDAHLFALALINFWSFHPANILLLTDENPTHPSYALTAARDAADLRKYSPERSHIIQGLKWLTSGAQNGDDLVFFFAGHGLQLDNLSGWEGEGYDEAILPLDCTHQSGEVNAMTAVGIRKLLLSLTERVQLSIFLDCAGGQTMLDVAGTGSWSFIPGVIQKGLWPLTDATDKVQRAKYNSRVWIAPEMRRKDVRPRFLPGIEVGNTSDLADSSSTSSSVFVSKAHAFLFAGAPFGEVSIEAELPSLRLYAMDANGGISGEFVSKTSRKVVHGVFTWALVSAMQDEIFSKTRERGDRKVTFQELAETTRRFVRDLKSKHDLPYLEQVPRLTQYVPSGSDQREYVFFPFGGRIRQLNFRDSCDPVSLRRDYPYIPNRDQFCDVWRAEESLRTFGLIQLERNESVKIAHRQLEGRWRRTCQDENFLPRSTSTLPNTSWVEERCFTAKHESSPPNFSYRTFGKPMTVIPS